MHTQDLNEQKGQADQRNFESQFRDGLEFWTSEDGSLLSIVIDNGAAWRQRLRFNHPSVWEHEKFDPTRAKPGYVERVWAGLDFFDGGGQKRGKVWRIADHETPFAVMIYELQNPR